MLGLAAVAAAAAAGAEVVVEGQLRRDLELYTASGSVSVARWRAGGLGVCCLAMGRPGRERGMAKSADGLFGMKRRGGRRGRRGNGRWGWGRGSEGAEGVDFGMRGLRFHVGQRADMILMIVMRE